MKSFAHKMIADHSKANAELKQLASNKNLTVPAATRPEQQADKGRLAKLSGVDFDKEYMALMSAAHDKAVAAFENESNQGADADIRAWAAKTLPTLKDHQSLARQIAAKVSQ